ncbi:MAG: ABC transporter permease [Gemmataceae bacterium]
MLRHLRLLGSFIKFSLLGEMAFRANYLIKVVVEVLWLVLMIVFYVTLFRNTKAVAGWTEYQYFFFLGCFYALEGVVETLFMNNFNEFGELVRKGDLDLILLQPVDEQFMVSFRSFEWATVPNVIMGAGMMTYAAWHLHAPLNLESVGGFVIGLICALAIAYSFMLMLASTAVWLIRNQSLYELWWLFTSLMRYPRQIFEQMAWARPIGWFFTFVIPVLLAIYVPASSMVRVLERGMLLYAIGSAIVLLWISRQVFRRALRSYRSASS